jgi:hypothetical protein
LDVNENRKDMIHMETKEKRSYEGKCCESASGAGDCCSVMGKCKKKCRWFPLFPVMIGILLLLLGYYLNAEVTRILWMIVSGLIVLLGTGGLIVMSKVKAMCCGLE